MLLRRFLVRCRCGQLVCAHHFDEARLRSLVQHRKLSLFAINSKKCTTSIPSVKFLLDTVKLLLIWVTSRSFLLYIVQFCMEVYLVSCQDLGAIGTNLSCPPLEQRSKRLVWFGRVCVNEVIAWIPNWSRIDLLLPFTKESTGLLTYQLFLRGFLDHEC